jgi:hypothetical protein
MISGDWFLVKHSKDSDLSGLRIFFGMVLIFVQGSLQSWTCLCIQKLSLRLESWQDACISIP